MAGSWPAEQTVEPSGLMATHVTMSRWPVSVARHLPVLTSHSLTAPSLAPEARSLESRLTARQEIVPACPFHLASTWASVGGPTESAERVARSRREAGMPGFPEGG